MTPEMSVIKGHDEDRVVTGELMDGTEIDGYQVDTVGGLISAIAGLADRIIDDLAAIDLPTAAGRQFEVLQLVLRYVSNAMFTLKEGIDPTADAG